MIFFMKKHLTSKDQIVILLGQNTLLVYEIYYI